MSKIRFLFEALRGCICGVLPIFAVVVAGVFAVSPAASGADASAKKERAPFYVATSDAGTVTTQAWGTLPDGRDVLLHTLDNGRGMRVRICEYGAAIVSIEVPDRDGKTADVVLGYDDFAGYLGDYSCFGAVVGRVANRIAGGKFTLDGQTYKLAVNNASGGIPSSLHGGSVGFNRVLWKTVPRDYTYSGRPSVSLHYRSVDGEAGYPGNLDVTVTYYFLPWNALGNALGVRYTAKTDKATPVNLSQHSYFNLAGEGNGTVLGHQLRLHASRFTPVNAGLIPTGELLPVRGTPFDFTELRTIGERIGDKHPQMVFGGGYDHNWVLDGFSGKKRLHAAAELYEPKSGRVLSIMTTEPGIQIYTGNGLGGTAGKGGKRYPRYGGVALETQHFPDSINQPSFPNVVLRPGEPFDSATLFEFSTR